MNAQDMSILNLVLHASWVVQLVMLLLLCVSVASWAAIFRKLFGLKRVRSLGIGQQQLREQTGGIFVVTDARLRYLRPARLDDELIVTAQLQETSRASLTIVQQALLNNEQAPNQPRVLLSEGTIRIGWVDAASMRPARIPSTLLEQLS